MGHVTDPLRVRIGPAAAQLRLRLGERPRRGPRIPSPAMGPRLDHLRERQNPRARRRPGPLEGALGHVDRLPREAAQQRLESHRCQHMAADPRVAGGAREREGLDEMPLRGVVLAHVERGPADHAGQLGGHAEQLRADLVQVGARQQRCRAQAQALGDRAGLPAAAAVARVPGAGVAGRRPQLVEIGAADLPAAAVTVQAGVGLYEPAGDRCGVGRDGEGAAEEFASVHGAPEARGAAHGVGWVSGEIQPHLGAVVGDAAHADFRQADGSSEAFAQRNGYRVRCRRVGDHSPDDPVRDTRMGVGPAVTALLAQLVHSRREGLAGPAAGGQQPVQGRVGPARSRRGGHEHPPGRRGPGFESRAAGGGCVAGSVICGPPLCACPPARCRGVLDSRRTGPTKG